ncbi:DUF2845 domain-containing protein [Desulfonatronum parangueonense]
MKNALTCILAAGLLLCSSGWSLALRCGNELVKTGDSRMVVRNKCGEPHDIVVSTREIKVGTETTITTVIETWTYNLGPREFLYYLTFKDGKLSTIKTDGYGF